MTRSRAASFFLVAFSSTAAFAGAHTWDVWEIFSNADGTIQFVELRETNGTPAETGIGGHPVLSNPSGTSFTISHNVVGPTSGKSYLIATPAYAALPGAVAPDDIVPAGTVPWVQTADTSLTYSPYDTATWTAGALPRDGIHSLQRPGVGQALAVATNSPSNYAGSMGSIDVSPGQGLPGVPDGTLTVFAKLAPDGSSIQLMWDAQTCGPTNAFHIVYGQRSGWPAVSGGTYTPLGGKCGVTGVLPATWNPTPDAVDGSGLIWFLVLTDKNGTVEGPWGTFDASSERNGPGTNGASNVCGIVDRILSNTCGH